MTSAHFHILPSRAECCGLGLAEASSFGVPSLTTSVGGIPTAIRNGKNGQTFSTHDRPEAYCDFIEHLMSARKEYEQFALSSFHEYAERLNWATAGETVLGLLKTVCGSPLDLEVLKGEERPVGGDIRGLLSPG
jgi:glycosyltransferase involved in cell wall biosynthesis